MRHRRGLVLVVGLFVGLGPGSAPAQPPNEARIEAARERALKYLQGARGSTPGEQALVVTVLLKSGDPLDAPHIAPVLTAIVQRCGSDGNTYSPGVESPTEIYEAAVSLMALANADPDKYGRNIDAIARYLIEKQKPDGGWDYPSMPGGDTSVTQYAALALWDAVRSGTRVPLRVWDKVAAWHIKTQRPDGSFDYKPGNGSHQTTTFTTMTTAGVSTLYLCRMHLFPRAGELVPDAPPGAAIAREARKRRKRYGFLEPVDRDAEEEFASRPFREAPKPGDNVVTVALGSVDRAIERGTTWMTAHFSTRSSANWNLYHLYTLERYGALAGTDFVGEHDWYAEGAADLLASQSPEGSWTDAANPPVATGFGILFLSRATRKLLHREIRTRAPKLGTGLLMGGRGLPKDLEQLQIDEGALTIKKLKGPVADLLAELEKGEGAQVESAQAGIVDTLLLEKPEALVGQTAQLKRLVKDRRVEVRRTAYWALGRTDDQRLAPLLIEGLNDPDPDCVLEAQQALVFLSRKPAEPDLPEELTDTERKALITRWKAWYFSARPYDERDDLTPDPTAKRAAP